MFTLFRTSLRQAFQRDLGSGTSEYERCAAHRQGLIIILLWFAAAVCGRLAFLMERKRMAVIALAQTCRQ